MKRTPLVRKTRLERGGPIKPNAKRAKATKDAASGPIARRRFVSTLPCAACHVVGYSQGAHVLGNGGTGKKRGPKTIAPLCADRPGVIGCHTLHDQYFWIFVEQWPTWDALHATQATELAWLRHLQGGDS